ncbi:MAG: CvpA family protein [Deltaproteobacteria bacterium]|nr:CvpA family protein [Deltaproteobacteria bacterium]
MNSLDIIIICIMLFLIVRGIFRGILKEIVSLVGIVGGIWFANRYQPMLTAKLRHVMPDVPFLSLICFIALLVGVIIAANIIGSILRSMARKGPMGMVDRLFGAGLATAKGLIITYLGIVLLTFFLPAKTPLIAKSRLAPIIVSSYQNMVSLVSPDFYKKWKERFSEKSQTPPDVRKPIPSSKKPENGHK